MNSLRTNSKLSFLRCTVVFVGCLFGSSQTGCVSIVSQSTGNGHGMIRTVAHSTQVSSQDVNSSPCGPSCEEPCPLYDRREVLARTMSAMKPSRWVPQGVKNLGARACNAGTQCRENVASWYYTKCEWFEKKRAEANAPPWPRFHPVPTRPVFAPTEGSNPEEPECYGRFGKAE